MAKKGFEAARALLPYLKLTWASERSIGFFFRAEDFGNLLNSIDRNNSKLHSQLLDLEGEVPAHIIQEMKDSATINCTIFGKITAKTSRVSHMGRLI